MKRTFKSILAVALCFIMFIGTVAIGGEGFADVLSTIAFADDEVSTVSSGTCGDNLTWILDDEGTLTISGTGTMDDYYEFPWYSLRDSLLNVVIDDGVTSISDYAFSSYCYNLRSVTVPNSVTSFGNSCLNFGGIIIFASNSAAHEYAVNTECEYIDTDDESTWYYSGSVGDNLTWEIEKMTGTLTVNCKGDIPDFGRPYSVDETLCAPWLSHNLIIRSIVISDGCTGIGIGSFYNCENAENVDIPNSVEHINSYAFGLCYNLDSVVIPSRVDSIGFAAFGDPDSYSGISCDITIMNRNCYISDVAFPKIGTIKGFTGSTAETYAKNNGFKFVSIDADHTHEYDNDCDAICNTCNYEREISHSVTEWTTVTPATCVQKEIQQGICSECGETVTRGLETGDHSFKAKTVVAPTCTTMGYTLYECEYCGMLYTADITAPVAHTDADGDSKCDVCGAEISAKICEHKFVLTYTDATCTEKGSVTMTCSECGYSTSTEIAAKGHNYVDFVTAPTCTTEGYTLHHCAICGDEYTDTKVSATGHSIRMQKITPTCTENGCDLYICSVCGYNYFANEIPAAGHKASAAIKENIVVSTSSATGHYDNVVYCSVCDTEISRETVTTPAINSTAGVVLNASGGSVDYKTKVTLKATATGVPTGYYVAIYDGNTQVARGDNSSVSYNIGSMTSGKTYAVKIVDANGNVQKDASGNALQKEVNISVNASFIKKLVAFFKGLFGSLPSKTIGA